MSSKIQKLNAFHHKIAPTKFHSKRIIQELEPFHIKSYINFKLCITQSEIRYKNKNLLVDRRPRIKLLTNKAPHGNMRNIEKLRKPLSINMFLRARVSQNHPLHSSSRHPPSRVHHRPALAPIATYSLEFLVVLIVIVIHRRRRSIRSSRDRRLVAVAQRPRHRAEVAENRHGGGGALGFKTKKREKEKKKRTKKFNGSEETKMRFKT